MVKTFKENRGVILIYLFGSYAMGREKPFSDRDICVVADRGEILIHSSKKVDISVLHDLSLSRRFRVIKEGELLFQEMNSNCTG